MNKKFFSTIFITASVLGACSKDNDKPVEQPKEDATAKEVKDLDASSQTEWKYFSFSQGKEVTVTDPTTDLSWDIAFNRYNVKTNGGTSGKGQAEVVNTNSKEFDKITQTPTDGFVKDTEVTSQGRPGSQPTTISVNTAITGTVMATDSKGWWNYAQPVPPATMPTQEITKWVYVVKTADGKFAKIQLTGYKHSTNDKTGFIAFTYKYSTNGKF